MTSHSSRMKPILRAASVAFPLAHTLAIALLLSSCTKPEAPPPQTPAVFVTPARNDISGNSHTLSGTVHSRVESELSFRVGGKITARLVELGQVVRTGQALAQLDLADYSLGVAAAAEQLKMAEIESAQAASDAERFKRLLPDGSVGAADLERQQARADAALARASQARHQLELARNRATYATLTAPYDGTVTALRFEVGQAVAEGQMVMSMAKPDELEVVADVPEPLAGNLPSLQATAQLELPDVQTHNLKLREISPSAQATTRTFRARYTLQLTKDSADFKSLRLGMTAQVRLSQNLADAGMQSSAELPMGALLTTNGTTTVWLADEKTGALTRQTVQLISQTTNTVRVAGLPDGALVVSAGAQKLDPKLKVRTLLRPLAKTLTAS